MTEDTIRHTAVLLMLHQAEKNWAAWQFMNMSEEAQAKAMAHDDREETAPEDETPEEMEGEMEEEMNASGMLRSLLRF